LTANPEAKPRRREIWRADFGGKKHTFVIVSVDARNLSERADSVLAVPFGSYRKEGPTVLRMEPGETGLREPSFLKAHFINVLPKASLIDRLPRRLSNAQLREVVLMIRRAVDPDAPFDPHHRAGSPNWAKDRIGEHREGKPTGGYFLRERAVRRLGRSKKNRRRDVEASAQLRDMVAVHLPLPGQHQRHGALRAEFRNQVLLAQAVTLHQKAQHRNRIARRDGIKLCFVVLDQEGEQFDSFILVACGFGFRGESEQAGGVLSQFFIGANQVRGTKTDHLCGVCQ